ncbi:MAG: hypothetical protein AAB348_01095 [Patescibacteria group bacterium]
MEENSYSPKQSSLLGVVSLLVGMALLITMIVGFVVVLRQLDKANDNTQLLQENMLRMQKQISSMKQAAVEKNDEEAAVMTEKLLLSENSPARLEIGKFKKTATGLVFVQNGKTIQINDKKLEIYSYLPDVINSTYPGVFDPRDGNKIIYSLEGDYGFNGIYSYDVNTKKSEKIFSETIDNATLDLFGLNASKLVIWKRGIDNSPGPCYSPVSKNNLSLYYLDLNNVSAGLKHFEPPTLVMEQVQAEAEQCMKDTF